MEGDFACFLVCVVFVVFLCLFCSFFVVCSFWVLVVSSLFELCVVLGHLFREWV